MAEKYLNYAGLQHLVEKIDQKYAPIAAIVFKGSVATIADLPALNTQKVGWMYNIETGGGTTSDFVEGAGHLIADGENVAVVELITGYEAVASVDPTDDPKALGWYEEGLTPGTYVLSTDRIPVDGKTYYTATTVKKWDTLGGLFDLEGRYLEFGTQFPESPANGRTFLYMGADTKVYTLVATPSGRPVDNGYFEGTFTPVADPSTIVNPKEEGLYEADSVTTGAYVHSQDTTPDGSKTYYTGVFVASSDTTVNPSKFYYTEADQYKHAVIYQYDATTAHDWVAQTSGNDMIAITNAEIDELFI